MNSVHFTSLISLTAVRKRLVLCFLKAASPVVVFLEVFWKISSTFVFLSLCLSAFPNTFAFQPSLSCSMLSARVLFLSLCHHLKVNYQVSNQVAHEKWPVKQPA